MGLFANLFRKSGPVESTTQERPAAPDRPAHTQGAAADEISVETVAAISAAVTMALGGESQPFVVRSIRRAPVADCTWALAGRLNSVK